MAIVRPFRALRYAAERTDPSRVWSPSSEGVDDAAHEALLAREPRNAVRALARTAEGESKSAAARRSGLFIAEWRRAGVLQEDEYASFYLLRTTEPRGRDDEPRETVGFYAAVELDEGSVLPGVQPDAAGVDAEAGVLAELGAQVAPPVLLYGDEPGRITRGLEHEMEDREPDVRVELDDVSHELWVVDDETTLARIAQTLSEQRLVVADGHERVAAAMSVEAGEAARARAEGRGDREPNRLVAFLRRAEDTGEGRVGVHRLVSLPPGVDASGALGETQRAFRRRAATVDAELLREIEQSDAPVAFALWLRGQGTFLCELLDGVDPAELWGEGEAGELSDAGVVDEVILGRLFGLGDADARAQHVRLRAGDAALRLLDEPGEGIDMAVLMRPPALATLLESAERGQPLAAGAMALEPPPPCGVVFAPLSPPVSDED
jgi:hypothetical protein